MRRVGLMLMIVLVLAELVQSSVGGKEAQERTEEVQLEVEPAIVGKPAKIRWQLAAIKNETASSALLSLTITQLEKGTRLFSLSKIPTDGQFNMVFHFTDGSDHRIRTIAEIEGRPPLIKEKTISVAAVEPPREAVLPSLILFLTVIAFGLVVGRIIR